MKCAAFTFQPTNCVFRLRFCKIIVLCGQILFSECEHGNSCVLISRIQPCVIVIAVIAYIVHLLIELLANKIGSLFESRLYIACSVNSKFLFASFEHTLSQITRVLLIISHETAENITSLIKFLKKLFRELFAAIILIKFI